jgi:hypothetical protein
MNEYYRTLIFNGNFAKIISTPAFRMLRNKLEGALRNSTLKLSFLFGHQSNLHPMLVLFNLTSPECLTQEWNNETVTTPNCVRPPGYAANMVVELYEENKDAFVKVKYNGYYVNLCQENKTECDYSEFTERVRRLEVNYEEQCKVKG